MSGISATKYSAGLVFLFAFTLISGMGRADELVLQEGLAGYDGTDDTSIYADFPDNTNGAGVSIYSGFSANAVNGFRRALIRFDLEKAGHRLPAGAVVESVALTLKLRKSGINANPPDPYTLHRLTADWGEGSTAAVEPAGTGAPAVAGDTTWSQRSFGLLPWIKPGGDFNSTASAEVPIFPFDDVFPDNNIYVISSTDSPELLNDVRAWLDLPALNFGWILIGNESRSESARKFGSSEAAVSGDRPKLTIIYSMPTPTETPTESPTESPTDTPSPTPTETPMDTPSPTPTPAPAQILAYLLGLGSIPSDVNGDTVLDVADLLQSLF